MSLAATHARSQPVSTELILNGRAFDIAPDTPVTVDGEVGVFADLARLPDGLQLTWRPAGDPAQPFRGGLPALVFSYTLIGPVTGTAPFAVLGQPLTVNADTTLAGFESTDALPVGTQLVVAGLLDANGSLLATLIERLDAPGNKYLLSGIVQQSSASELSVGTQRVDTTGVTFDNCAAALPAIGEFVELRATPISPFPPDTVLDTVFDARCVTPVPAGTPGAAGFVQAIISTVPDPDHVSLGALLVEVDADTVFVFGDRDDLEPGVAIAVDGTYTAALEFHADVIEYVRPVVRFEGPVDPAAVVPGESIRVLGVTVRNSAQVRDEDGILANGLTLPQQVEVRGYLDQSGQAFATRVRERGDPDATDTRVRGPVQSVAAPVVTIQGIAVDVSTAIIVDHDGAPLSSEEFFALVGPDLLVDAFGGPYDAAQRRMTPTDVVFIGAEPVPPPPGSPQGTGVPTIRSGTATGYAAAQSIFGNGFEQAP